MQYELDISSHHKLNWFSFEDFWFSLQTSRVVSYNKIFIFN